MKSPLTRILARLNRGKSDPDRVQRVFREYEEDRGFSLYHARCKEAFTREPLPEASKALAERGFEYLDVLGAPNARALLARLTDRHSVSSVKKDNASLIGFQDIDDNFRRDIMQTLLTPSVDQRIAGYFGSEYLVLWMIVTATEATAADEIVSFKWHCDRGPRHHLKLLVYLNSTTEHGANTEFIPLADSERIASQGYVFGSTRKRTNDAGRLSRLAGKTVETVLDPIQEGSGVLFRPASVLHRGVAPDRGTRYAVTLCLLPSPVPWHQALDKGLLFDLNTDEKWPSHASELMRVLEK